MTELASQVVRAFDVETSIAAVFFATAGLHADRPAIVSAGRTVTYGELASRAETIAGTLAAAGVGRGDRAAVLLDQGERFLSGLLGILRAGAAFVPLDPTYPADRNAFMLADSGAGCLVTDEVHADAAAAIALGDQTVINLDRTPACVRSAECEDATPGDTAYILYTSGSTGTPKGVVQPHRAVLHNALRHTRYFQITPDDRQTLLYPCSVYGGIRDILNALLNGAALYHFPVREEGYAGLADWLGEHQITIYCSVASVFRRFARDLEGADLFPHLRIVKLGGEAPYATDVELFRERLSSHTVLFCGLGSTETGMSRRFPLTRETTLPGNAVPLGYAVDGVDVVIVDEHGKPVAPGAVGEITIQSRYITTGYHNRDDLNAKVMRRCEDDAEARIFCTGDLGRQDPDGCLWHCGRKDHQVKIRGNRVELLEVEAAVSAHADIRDAVALAETDDKGDACLIAYVTLAPGVAQPPSAGELRESMKDRVPRFMIPSEFRLVSEIPLTPNGKIDRSALARTSHRVLAAGRTFIAATSPAHRTLAEIFVATLGRGPVGITDSFFDLGGDSLMAVDLILRIEHTFGRAPTLATLLLIPNVIELAGWLAGAGDDQQLETVVALNKVPGAARGPLFVLPGKGGSVLSYMALTQRLDGDRVVYGLQLPGLIEGEEPFDRVEPLAERMIERIRCVQPHGPYRLLGYSFGGLVAYEVAKRLSDAGETVSLLALLDTSVPGSRQRRSAVRRMAIHAQSLLAARGADRWRYILDHVKPRRAKEAPPPSAFGAATALRERLSRMAMASSRALARYKPPDYAGPLTLLQCQGKPEWMRFVDIPADYGWSACCTGPIRLVPIPGVHNEIFRPANVDGLAGAVNALLREVAD